MLNPVDGATCGWRGDPSVRTLMLTGLALERVAPYVDEGRSVDIKIEGKPDYDGTYQRTSITVIGTRPNIKLRLVKPNPPQGGLQI